MNDYSYSTEQIGYPLSLPERALMNPGMIEFEAPYIACAGPVAGHTDELFPEWSAFLTLRNDGCRVWQRKGYKGIPAVGERFTLNIHQTHGTRATRRKVLVVLCADGESKDEAEANLDKLIRDMLADDVSRATRDTGK